MDARVGWRDEGTGASRASRSACSPASRARRRSNSSRQSPIRDCRGAGPLRPRRLRGGVDVARGVHAVLRRRGRACAAVSLRGHGASEGRAGLRAARLSDYRDDLQRAFAALPEPPVVVAHSLGGLLAQQLIGREEMRGLALLASLPPEGLWLESPRLAITDPQIWLEAVAGSAAGDRRPIGMAAHEVLFSEGLPREHVARYAALMTPESPRALADAHVPGPIVSAHLAGVRRSSSAARATGSSPAARRCAPPSITAPSIARSRAAGISSSSIPTPPRSPAACSIGSRAWARDAAAGLAGARAVRHRRASRGAVPRR